MSKLYKFSIISAGLITSTLFFSSAAFAQGKPSSRPSPRSVSSQSASQSAGTRLNACQAREKSISTRSEKLIQSTTKIEETFDKIALRVEDYYENKLLPAGNTIAGYDTLVSDIDAKKADVQTALTKAQTDLDAFSCTEGDPKSALTSFNQDMRDVKSALSDFRRSIRDLIVGVRSSTGQQNRHVATSSGEQGDENNDGSPEPSHTPRASRSPHPSEQPEGVEQ